MSTTPQPIVVPGFLQQVIAKYDAYAEDFHEYELSGAINEAAKSRDTPSEDDRHACMAESWAFGSFHSNPGQTSEWGTHFCGPDVRRIDSAVVAHWGRRRDQVRHPVMRARYADLLWDFRKHVTGRRADVNDARVAIDFGTYFALVIGNRDYKNLADVPSARDDADDIAEVLTERFGFQVEL